ncbi:hypothetical protein J6590_007081 [Homalodisca vitripennis]|nr:hypothetical protein J6590_007081 [Homalodisca vitripennis]
MRGGKTSDSSKSPANPKCYYGTEASIIIPAVKKIFFFVRRATMVIKMIPGLIDKARNSPRDVFIGEWKAGGRAVIQRRPGSSLTFLARPRPSASGTDKGCPLELLL